MYLNGKYTITELISIISAHLVGKCASKVGAD